MASLEQSFLERFSQMSIQPSSIQEVSPTDVGSDSEKRTWSFRDCFEG